MAETKLTTLEQLQMLAQRANVKMNQISVSIPTKVSQLTNDSKFQTDTEVAAAIASIDSLHRKKVASISDIDVSAADAEKFIYMVPKSTSGANDVYDEYMVIDGALEHVGNTAINMDGFISTSDIATDAEVTAALDTIFGSGDGV